MAVCRPEAGGPVRVAESFFFHSMLMPAFDRQRDPDSIDVNRIMLTTQRSSVM